MIIGPHVRFWLQHFNNDDVQKGAFLVFEYFLQDIPFSFFFLERILDVLASLEFKLSLSGLPFLPYM